MSWFERMKGRFKIFSFFIACIVAGGFYASQFVKENPDIPDVAHNMVHPPTSKSEDLYEVSQDISELKEKMEIMMHLLNNLQDRVEAKRIGNIKMCKVGINNYELSKWEISVSGKNPMHLEEGNEVLIVNSRSEHKESGHYRVKFVRKNIEEGKPELYINHDAAIFLGIENPELLGTFELSVERITQ